MNSEACRITGYPEEELVGMRISDLVPPDSHEAALAHFGRTQEAGRSEGIIPFLKKDGTKRYLSVNGVRLSEARFMGFVEDVTERLQIEKELVASEARFKALFEASFGGIVIHEMGLVLACNLGLSRLTGFNTDELIGMDGLLLIAPEERDRVRERSGIT